MTIETRNAAMLAPHAGHRRDETTGAVAVPIGQTTSYQFDSTALLVSSGQAATAISIQNIARAGDNNK